MVWCIARYYKSFDFNRMSTRFLEVLLCPSEKPMYIRTRSTTPSSRYDVKPAFPFTVSHEFNGAGDGQKANITSNNRGLRAETSSCMSQARHFVPYQLYCDFPPVWASFQHDATRSNPGCQSLRRTAPRRHVHADAQPPHHYRYSAGCEEVDA